MPFYNREEDIRRMKAVLSGEPNLVYFVYGPINSGKTALLRKVFEELPEEYRVFYINFRWRYVDDVGDLIKVLFRVRGKERKLSEFLESVLKGGARVFEKLGGIPIPEDIFELLFRRADKVEDVFAFLKDYFTMVMERGYSPVLIFDEMQTIKDVINASGKPVIHRLFNFLVGLTKETHLCHYLCATSDSLFIESVYSNARLEGRAEYILVDDLFKDRAFEVYERFGFQNKEMVWDYIGGKMGDMVILYEEKKQGYSEEESLKKMLGNEVGRLEWIRWKKLSKMEDGEEKWQFLKKFTKEGELNKGEIGRNFDKLLFWIEENVLFYNPVGGTVRPQGRLIQRAIGELF